VASVSPASTNRWKSSTFSVARLAPASNGCRGHEAVAEASATPPRTIEERRCPFGYRPVNGRWLTEQFQCSRRRLV
jgi:hypothetical protein